MIKKDEILVLDAQTLKDLEVFDSASEEASLFQFCNTTKTTGGEKVLRQRMENPWASAVRIEATQISIGFILERREVFADLLGLAYSAGRVRQYSHESLPVITHENNLAFGLEALALWANGERHYGAIVRGVKFTRRLIQGLRHFISIIEPLSAKGEILPLINEMGELLQTSGIDLVPNEGVVTGVWRKLRFDQIFRVTQKAEISRMLELFYEIDALVAMAEVTADNDFVMPEIASGPVCVHADELFHPFVIDAVANPVELNQTQRLLFLTGPNMAGKTTYLRAFAMAVYLAHLGMGVPSKRFRFVPIERLFTSLSLSDDLAGGVSYFRAEALRVKAVAEAVATGFKVIALMDEPFKGTNVKDAFDASRAILSRLATKQDCLFMFSSHLIELSETLVSLTEVDCRYFDAEEGADRLSFDYQLHSGISSQRLGMRVLREEGIFDLLDA